jgi:membrane-associated phospholipid phosphatase
LNIVSAFIFVIFPTTYPRELYPLPADLDLLTYSVFFRLRETDTPANCCPSLHVSSVYLSSLLFLHDRKRMFPFFFTWGTAIAVSTLTTKQHYFIDVITGLIMAAFAHWIFHRIVQYYEYK